MASNNSCSKNFFKQLELGKLGNGFSCSVCNPFYAQELCLLSSTRKGGGNFKAFFKNTTHGIYYRVTSVTYFDHGSRNSITSMCLFSI